MLMSTFQINEQGFYGDFGGAYIPEILHRCVSELQQAYRQVIDSPEFQREFDQLLRDYVGRPSPLYLARRLSAVHGCRIYLKREDLNHTGAHKINNAIGQVLLARRMGKTRIIAETGAGQHGVATATVCALMNMECIVFMGRTDVMRQRANVEKMKMLGAKVCAVDSGNKTLKDATNEAIRYWCCHPDDTYYVIGSTVGPHPYPDMVVRIILAEAGGEGIDSPRSAATIHLGRPGIIHGARTLVMQDADGQIQEPYSISAGLDYPGVGPLHAHLASQHRAQVMAITDSEALHAAYELTRLEGIIPALESAHALAALHRATFKPQDIVVLTVSGRGDKDMDTYLKHLNEAEQ